VPTRRLGEETNRDAMMKETVSKTARKAAATPAGATAASATLESPGGPAPGAVKSPATSASRPAAKAAAAPKPPAQAGKAAQKAAAKTQATPAHPAAAAGSKETAAGSPAPAPAVQVADELADKMKPSVVSKVSEVMTKTTKPNTAAQSEAALLTEEQIRAMRDEDYMNPAQLAFFRNRLQELEKELLKNAGETTEHLRETVLVPDPADRATIEEEHALELRTRDRERKLLKKVQQSLASIESGEYGWCEETGEPIGIPRLIARPTATLSLEAQQRRELKQKLYGD
jgi:DnaK suppressor protein